jgi:hypothetical protein
MGPLFLCTLLPGLPGAAMRHHLLRQIKSIKGGTPFRTSLRYHNLMKQTTTHNESEGSIAAPHESPCKKESFATKKVRQAGKECSCCTLKSTPFLEFPGNEPDLYPVADCNVRYT